MTADFGTVLDKGIAAPGYRLPSTAHVGRVRLAVSELERSVEFYRDVIGLAVVEQSGNLARLGVGETVLLELEAAPGVRARGRTKRLGLYHTAFLLPTREDLSAFVRHLWKRAVRFGAGDHLVSEALYLVDPDGLEVEVYADRPRDSWTFDGAELQMATEAVRFAELPAVPDGAWQGAPAGSTVGHVHLYVGDLKAAADFYHTGLGLDIMTWRFPGALFTSAGGYHHHVGLNTWAAASPVASENDARMLFWELVLPEEEIRSVASSLRGAGFEESAMDDGAPCFVDPWGIRVALAAQ